MDFFWARNIVTALQALNIHKFDLMFLDHDLEFGPGNGYCEMSSGCGMDIVDKLVLEKYDGTAVVHSLNCVAGPEMFKRLVDGGIRSILAQGFWMDGTWNRLKSAIGELGGN